MSRFWFQEELVKRRRMEAQQQPQTVQRAPNRRLQTMASQVKEVLPHVPMNTILSDLSKEAQHY